MRQFITPTLLCALCFFANGAFKSSLDVTATHVAHASPINSPKPIVNGIRLDRMKIGVELKDEDTSSINLCSVYVPAEGNISNSQCICKDDLNREHIVDSFNCFESVNYMMTGNPNLFAYREWPTEKISTQTTDDWAMWVELQSSLRPGDVVEFHIRQRIANGEWSDGVCHAQLCIAAGGVMYGANTEPRFEIANGAPSPTRRWWLCSPRDYYEALRSVDADWEKIGHEREYSVWVYRKPITLCELATAE